MISKKEKKKVHTILGSPELLVAQLSHLQHKIAALAQIEIAKKTR
jgi:hypothetical protein